MLNRKNCLKNIKFYKVSIHDKIYIFMYKNIEDLEDFKKTTDTYIGLYYSKIEGVDFEKYINVVLGVELIIEDTLNDLEISEEL